MCGVHGLLERVYLGRPGLFRPGRTVSLAKGAVDGERWCVLCPVLEGFARAREPRSRRGRAAPSARRAVFGLCVVSQGCCVLERGYAVLALYGRQGSGRRGERPHAVCVVVFARVLRKSPRAERAPRQPSLCTRACGAWSPVSGWRRNGVQICMAQARAVMCVVVWCMGRWESSSERPHADCLDGAGPFVVSAGRYTVMPLLPSLQLDSPELSVARLPSRELRPLGLGPVP